MSDPIEFINEEARIQSALGHARAILYSSQYLTRHKFVMTRAIENALIFCLDQITDATRELESTQ